MKHWLETSQVLRRAARLAALDQGAALATVIRIAGSAYRRPGAKMLVAQDGSMTGSVSGGCLEADVREVGLSVIRTGGPRLLHYDTGSDDRTVWGLGLGCNGSVDIFVRPVAANDATIERVRALLEGENRFTVSTVVAGSPGLGTSLVAGAAGLLIGSTGDAALDRSIASRSTRLLAEGETSLYEVGPTQVFTEALVPPPDLLICGAGDDAVPLAASAGDAGFRLTVVDHRPAYLTPERFPEGARLIRARPEDGFGTWSPGPQTYVVVKTHSLTHDRERLRRLLATGAPYLGVLGPRDRLETILEQLGVARSDRVFGPIGLDLGAEGAEQIAVSIVGELLAVRSGRLPRHLRDREAAIHAE